MNSKDLGAHLVFAWPQAEIGVMSAGAAALFMRPPREQTGAADSDVESEWIARYTEEHLTAAAAARRGLVDEVIQPRETRARLRWGLALLGGPGMPKESV
jgi:propionyl-CoA carboxylase beta chain